MTMVRKKRLLFLGRIDWDQSEYLRTTANKEMYSKDEAVDGNETSSDIIAENASN